MAETIGLRAVIDVSQFNKGLGSYNKGINQMNKKTTQATKGMTSSFAKVGPALLSVGALAGGAAVAGLVAFGKAAIEEGRAFTQAMSNVQAISGATGDSFAALESQAKKLGATTKFTAVEAAEGMTFLAQAGFETVDILAAMPATLNLAAASNLDLGKSADIVSNILTGFGATADSTGKFVDVLTNTFTTSNTDLVQLGQAMKNVAPVAASLGLSVEETAAALGKMADAGIQGGAAGTQLKNALLNLTAPSAQQTALMKELGIEIFNASGEMKTLPEIVGEVNEGLSGLSAQQEIAAIKTLAGKRAIAGFQVLLNQGEPALEAYAQSLEKSGTAADVASTQLDNLEGDITLLNSAFSGFKLAAFDLLEPALRSASASLTGFLTKLNEGADAWSFVFNEAIPAIKAHGEAVKELEVSQANLAGRTLSTIETQEGLFDTLATGEQDIEAFRQGILESANSQEEYEAALKRVQAVAPGFFLDLRVTGDEYENLATATTTANRAQSEAAQSMRLAGLAAQIQAEAEVEVTKSITDLISETNSLIAVEADVGQQSIELARNRSFVVTESDKLAAVTAQIKRETEAYEQAQIDAAAAEEARQQTTLALLSTMGTFFSGTQDAREESLESERQFNASITDIRTNATEAQTSAREAANTKLTELEEQRAAEEHRILTGAHARTTEANDALLAENNAHFAELAAAESASLTGRQAEIEKDFATREGQAQAARDKELAAQQAHLEELKLNAALATLESTGQLAQFTGGLAVSASEAAELIRSGVIPVTQELGAAIQGTLAELGAKEGEVTAQLASNQAILQEAFAGTLEPIKAQVLALGTDIPAAAATAQAATGLANADVVAGAQSAALASQEQDLALQNLGTATFPTLGMAAQTATTTMNEAFATAATPIEQMDLTLNNMSLVTLPLLQETSLIVTTAMLEQLSLLLSTGVLPINLALNFMAMTILPLLQSTMISVAAASVVALVSIQAVLEILMALITEVTALTIKFGEAALKAGEDAAKGFEKAAGKIDELKEKLLDLTATARALADALADAAAQAVDLSNAASGAGFSGGGGAAQGMGFQAGLGANTNGPLGLGFRIPPGFPNDSFGPLFAQSGEEMLITPRGMSIEGLIFSRLANLLRGTAVQGGSVTNNITNNFQMNVQTSSTPQAVTRQFEVMRGFVGT